MNLPRNAFSIAGLIMGVAGIICGLAPLAMQKPVPEERSKLTRAVQAWTAKKAREPNRGNGIVTLIAAGAILGLASSGCGAIASARRENRGLVLAACFLGGLALTLAGYYLALTLAVLIGALLVLLLLLVVLRNVWDFTF